MKYPKPPKVFFKKFNLKTLSYFQVKVNIIQTRGVKEGMAI